MPVRRQRNAGTGQSKERQSRDMQRSKLTLFIQQFEKEAQERMNELEVKLENMLATVDKAFKVELMKMSPSLQNALMEDLLSEDVSASEVSIAVKRESPEMPQSVRRMPSRRVKSAAPPPTPGHKASQKLKGSKRTKTLVCSNSTGSLMGSSVNASRTRSGLSNSAANNQTKPKLRSVVSAGDMHCAIAGGAAHVTVTTARGEAVSFSEEMENDVNCDLLDDVAWHQIQKLVLKTRFLDLQTMLEDLSQRKSKDA